MRLTKKVEEVDKVKFEIVRTTEREIIPEVGKPPVKQLRILAKAETGEYVAVTVPAEATEEEILKALEEKLKRKSPLEGKVLGG